MENYLGICYVRPAGHDSGIGLVDEEGNILYAANEERFERIKLYGGYPEKALEHMFKEYCKDIDVITMPQLESLPLAVNLWNHHFTNPYMDKKEKIIRFFYEPKFIEGLPSLIKSPKNFFKISKPTALKMFYKTVKPYLLRKKHKEFFGKKGINPRLKHIEHHNAHASCAYYTSGFKKALVMTLDGEGDFVTSVAMAGKGSELEPLEKHYYPTFTYGTAYAAITRLLGFTPSKHEGKITGLAAYGKKNDKCIRDVEKFVEGARYTFEFVNSDELLTRGAGLVNRHSREDISYAIQYILEKNFLLEVERVRENHDSRYIALAGGVLANVKLNQRIAELGFKKIFIHPAMGDVGIGLGSALYALAEEKGVKPKKLKDAYLGPGYTNEEIRKELDKNKLRYEKLDDIEGQVAELLAKGYVVARFNERMEYGPRALGNRSILYSATDPSVNDWLNKRLKRTEFMPFAPSTLREYAEKSYLNLDSGEFAATFMTITFDCTDWVKETSPAIVHVDGTARPQLVRKSENKSYYKIIDEYRKITGFPTIVNTSFNMHEEPIVCTPYDAIRAFKLGHLDYLAIGNYLVKNEDMVEKPSTS